MTHATHFKFVKTMQTIVGMNYKYFSSCRTELAVKFCANELNHGLIFQREMFCNLMECFSQGDNGKTSSVFIENVQ